MRPYGFTAGHLYLNSVAALVARVAYAAGQWGQVVVIARLTNAETVGLYGLAQALTAPVFGLLSLDLRALVATDSREHFTPLEYVSLRIYTSICAVVITFLIVAVVGYPITTVTIIALVVAIKVSDSISDALYGIMQRYERMDVVAISSVLKSGISLTVIAIVMTSTQSLAWGLVGVTATWGVILVLCDIRWSGKLSWPVMRLSPKLGRLRRLAWEALPLGLVAVLMSLQTNVPRYFLDGFHGSEALGHFTVLMHFLIAGTIANGAIQQGLGQRLAMYYNADEQSRFGHLFLILSGASLCLGVLGLGIILLFGPQMLTLIYGESYAKYAYLLPYLMGAGIATYLFASFSTALTVMRNLSPQAKASACGAFACFLSGWMLIPAHGLTGAAYAVLTGGIATSVVGGVALVRGLVNKHGMEPMIGQDRAVLPRGRVGKPLHRWIDHG